MYFNLKGVGLVYLVKSIGDLNQNVETGSKQNGAELPWMKRAVEKSREHETALET